MHHTLAKHLLFTLERLRGEHVRRYLRELEHNQHLPAGEYKVRITADAPYIENYEVPDPVWKMSSGKCES